MASVKIVATPEGEAPKEIRRAWVGVIIPLPQWHPPGPFLAEASGVLSRRPKSRLGLFWSVLMGRTKRQMSYS